MADLKAADIIPGVHKTHSEVFLIHGLLWLSSLNPVNGYVLNFQKVDNADINLIYNYFNHTERNQFWGYYAHNCIKIYYQFLFAETWRDSAWTYHPLFDYLCIVCSCIKSIAKTGIHVPNITSKLDALRNMMWKKSKTYKSHICCLLHIDVIILRSPREWQYMQIN